jgi:Homing endonuclease associated repeat
VERSACRPPLSIDWRRAATDHPTASLVQGRFGSWRAALEAAGVAPGGVEWTRERVLDAIRAHIDRQGRPPLSSDWRRPEDVSIPATHVVVNRFGSWRAAIAAAGRGEIRKGEPR